MVSVALASAIAIGTLMIVTIVVTLMTGSVLAAGVVVALIAIAYTVLVYYGFLNVKVTGTQVDISLWDVVDAVTPKPMPVSTLAPVRGKEVYYVGDNLFTYDEAPAVCAAYGGDLASQDQVESAFADGAEWCGYGWSAGGVALFPTQRATWELLQKEADTSKRTACGRPGVNGGYFDPSLKFGVNCYGVKPEGSAILPQPPPGTDMKTFNERVAKFKTQLKDFFLAPFNRTTWADASPTLAGYGSQFSQNIGGLAGSSAATSTPQSTVSSGSGVGYPYSGTTLPLSTVETNRRQDDTTPMEIPTPTSTTTSSAPAYSSTKTYSVGDKVSFKGSIYTMVEGAGAPGFAPDRPGDRLWQIKPSTPTAAAAYSATKTYSVGDTISFNGSTYKMVEGAGSPGFAPDRPGDRLWQKV